MADDPLAIEMIGISKRFGPVQANSGVDFSVRSGEIHCLVGENGAGKTTLMNMLYGLLPPDEGQIRLFGRNVAIRSPLDAMRLGIGMVHQHFKLVPSFTVVENVILGRETVRHGLLDRTSAAEAVKALARDYGLDVDARAQVRSLPVGVRQRVEILKTLYRGSEIIVLDEPTAVLTPQESGDLFATIKRLVAGGKTVVFITHKLKEVMAVADRVTVLRRGSVVGTLNRAEITEQVLSRMMVGREVLFDLAKTEAHPGRTILDVQDLWVGSGRGFLAVRGVSLAVHAGEIVTIAGVEGNGQTELVQAVAGLRPVLRGAVKIDGQATTNLSPAQVRAAGLAHVPEDRMATGLCVDQTVAENLAAGLHNRPPFCQGIFLNLKDMDDYARANIEKFGIVAAGPGVQTRTLSGGNMQKLVIARELLFKAGLLLAVQPTRGVDVGAIESIHRMLFQARDAGCAILLVSTDLDEVFQVSDRIMVLYNGEIVGEFVPRSTTREELGAHMIGARRGASPN